MAATGLSVAAFRARRHRFVIPATCDVHRAIKVSSSRSHDRITGPKWARNLSVITWRRATSVAYDHELGGLMFRMLLESRATRHRRTGGAALSVAAHVAIIGFTTVATMHG